MNTIFRAVTILAMAHIMILDAAIAQETVESGHIAVETPATLSPDEANQIYDELRKRMSTGYAIAGLPIIKDYQFWKRYNSSPYLSATHGQRFVNNFANTKASTYGKLKSGEVYPEGTVFAKDTVTVTSENKIFPGAIFIMEKLAKDANPETADWRYVTVLPDGTLFGDTTGAEPELAQYCHACHQAKAKEDYVFYVPEEFQIKN